MQEISRGKKCLLSINIAKVGAVQNAVKIDTHIISPSGVVSCVANGYDELKKVVALIISGDVLNEVGAYSIDLRLVFADSVIIVPTFAFAEVVEGEVPCYGVSEVYVSIEGGEVVPSGNTTTIEFVSREEFEQLSNKVDELEEQIGSGSDSITIDTELSETSDNAIANSAVAKALKDKQNTLTLSTKPNGNIVIGNLAGQTKEFMPATPSGDPMHYMYEEVGAVYNESTGYWELNELSDITNSEMRIIYKEAWLNTGNLVEGIWYRCSGRTNISQCGYVSSGGVKNVCVSNASMETFTLGKNSSITANIPTIAYSFRECPLLRSIIGVMNLTYTKTIDTLTFSVLPSLENLRIYKLKTSISFADSSNLSKESLLYMIDNCESNETFTITMHPDVYDNAKDSWTTEIEDAIEAASINKGTTITLASA